MYCETTAIEKSMATHSYNYCGYQGNEDVWTTCTCAFIYFLLGRNLLVGWQILEPLLQRWLAASF